MTRVRRREDRRRRVSLLVPAAQSHQPAIRAACCPARQPRPQSTKASVAEIALSEKLLSSGPQNQPLVEASDARLPRGSLASLAHTVHVLSSEYGRQEAVSSRLREVFKEISGVHNITLRAGCDSSHQADRAGCGRCPCEGEEWEAWMAYASNWWPTATGAAWASK